MTNGTALASERKIVAERFFQLIRENHVLRNADPADVRDEDLVGTGILDSLGLLKLLALVEDEFGVHAGQEELITQIRTIEECVDYIFLRQSG